MNARQKWPDTRELPAYAVGDAALYLQLSQSTLRAWTFGQNGFQPVIRLPQHAHRLSFVNLVEAHVLKAIRRQHGVPLQAVRRALDYVEKELKVTRPSRTATIRRRALIDSLVRRRSGSPPAKAATYPRSRHR